MIAIRSAGDHGCSRALGLESQHGFSFGGYHDPARIGMGPLRVFNAYVVAPGGGLAEERRANMEILAWVVSGHLDHRDSIGGDGVLAPGELLHLSAGSGIRHSERNASVDESLRFLQMWIQPNRLNMSPRVARRMFPAASRRGRLCLIASGNSGDDALFIAQNGRLYASLLNTGDTLDVPLDAERQAYIQIVRGRVAMGALEASAGDSIVVTAEENLHVRALAPVELLWLDLALSPS